MKRFYRIEHNGTPSYAVEVDGDWNLVEGDIFGKYKTGEQIAANGHKLLAPIIPSKIIGVGLNYKDHAAEQNKPLPDEPLIFMKPSSAIIGPGEPIVLPEGIGRVDHEAELGVVIGSQAWQVSEQEASKYVFGFTCVNDVSARVL